MTKPPKAKTRRDPLLGLIEARIKELLDPDTLLTPAERIKVIEAANRVLAIRHKIEDGAPADGSFFAK